MKYTLVNRHIRFISLYLHMVATQNLLDRVKPFLELNFLQNVKRKDNFISLRVLYKGQGRVRGVGILRPLHFPLFTALFHLPIRDRFVEKDYRYPTLVHTKFIHIHYMFFHLQFADDMSS